MIGIARQSLMTYASFMTAYFDADAAPGLRVRHRAEPLRGAWAAKAAIGLFAVTLLCFTAMICIGSLKGQTNTQFRTGSFIGGGPVDPDAARLKRREEKLDLVMHGITAATFFTCFAAACCFTIWLTCVQRNLANLQVEGLSNQSGCFIWACIVPGINLWKPYAIVQETWKASDPYATENPHAWREISSAVFIWSWWVFSLTASAHLAAHYLSATFDPGPLAFGCAFAIAACGLSIATIVSIGRRQTERRMRLFAYIA